MSNKYIPTTWIGAKTVGTADVMNNIEQGINGAHDRLDGVDEQFNTIAQNLGYVTYEMFGAKSDGDYDDGIAIKLTHEFANSKGYSVIADSSKTYHIKSTSEIIIKTNTNFNNCKLKIYEDEGHYKNIIFRVKSNYEPVQIPSNVLTNITLNKTTKVIPQLAGYGKCFVNVINDNKKQYIRKGENADSGVSQTDQFVIDNIGNVLNDIIWDFDNITSITLYQIDENILTIDGLNVEVVENTKPVDSDYLVKNFEISRSNVVVNNYSYKINPHVINMGKPSRGFLYFTNCCNVSINNAIFDSRPMRAYNGANIGNYSLQFERVVDITLNNVDSLTNDSNTKWGFVVSNYVKDVKIYNSKLNRFDTHKSIHNLTIRDSVIGNKGLTLTGSGNLILDNITIYSTNVVNLRSDYGSTWNGKIELNNIKHITNNTDITKIINYSNDGTHDFGYDCFLGTSIEVNGYYLDNTVSKNGDDGYYLIYNELGSADVSMTYKYFFPNRIIFTNISMKNSKGFILINKLIDKLSSKSKYTFNILKEESVNARLIEIKENCIIELDNVQLYDFPNYDNSTTNLIRGIALGSSGSDDYLSDEYRIVPHIIVRNSNNVYANMKGFPCKLTIDNSIVRSIMLLTTGTRSILNLNNLTVEPILQSSISAFRYNGLSSIFNNVYFKRPKLNGEFVTDYSNLKTIYTFLSEIKSYESWKYCRLLGSFTNCKLDNWIDMSQIYSDYKIYGFQFGNTKNEYYCATKGSTSSRPTEYCKNGHVYYDTTLNTIIFFDGTNWRKYDGTTV